MTAFFDPLTGRPCTRDELAARLPAVAAGIRMVRVVVELFDAQGAGVTQFAPEFTPDVAASVVGARIIPDDPAAEATL